MSRLVLLRHAQSEWNADGRWQGWADPPLSPLGEAQTAAVACHLADTELGAALSGPAISSDLRRARQTAEILAVQLGLPFPGRLDPDLREIDVGEWSGLRREEIAARWPEWLQRWDSGLAPSAPGGERRAGFDARVRAAAERCLAAAQGGTRLAVTHGGVIRSLTRSAAQPPLPVANLTGVLLETFPLTPASRLPGPTLGWTFTPLLIPPLDEGFSARPLRCLP